MTVPYSEHKVVSKLWFLVVAPTCSKEKFYQNVKQIQIAGKMQVSPGRVHHDTPAPGPKNTEIEHRLTLPSYRTRFSTNGRALLEIKYTRIGK